MRSISLNFIRKALFLFVIGFAFLSQAYTQSVDNNFISFSSGINSFSLVSNGKAVPVYVGENEFAAVKNLTNIFVNDIQGVTGIKPLVKTERPSKEKLIVIIGTIGNSNLIDELIKKKKIDVSAIQNNWEATVIQTVDKPFEGVDQALVIAGSDRRGTIYGMLDISQKIGVSPWYWWADVPVEKHHDIYIKPGKYINESPKVKYRGFFINDEAPALSGWSKEKFGGFNHLFYKKVFELLLRLKGNYLWPAMWGSAFNDDDPLNAATADSFAVVMGTSHHEPLVRAHDEWRRYGSGPWNYDKNEAKLKEFWTKGIQRMGSNENIVTIGMRGDGDEPMSEESNIALLERIVKDQRQIIQDITGKPAEKTPQMWALYKEVQDYYDKGMRVPEDVTLLLCDDNWGNIRKLPNLSDKPRSGGYGIYYHFDYVGGPRNYKWVNTNPIARVWEQMHLAYEYGAKQIWIVNVGDIKPMEFPLQFFLDYAWNPEKIQASDLKSYTQQWSEQQFGKQNAESVADIVTKYLKYNGRRKPELLSPSTYSLFNYKEAETIVKEYNSVLKDAESINENLPAQYRDAYYQLVLHPVQACANINELYVTVGKNRWYAKQGRNNTNELAIKAKELYEKDSLISLFYNKTLANGKWNHMMDQTHIGYTYWQQPPFNSMPKVRTIEVPDKADMGVSIEGSELWWPADSSKAVLPEFNNIEKGTRYFEIFNRGKQAFTYTVESPSQAVSFSSISGTLDKDMRIWVNVDWQYINQDKTEIPITVKASTGQKVIVYARLRKIDVTGPAFVASDGYVSIEAENYSDKKESDSVKCLVIPDLGRTLSGITPVPVTAAERIPQGNSPHLEYTFYSSDTGKVQVNLFLSPSLYFNNKGLRYAVSIDNDVPQIIDIHTDRSLRAWEKWVSDNVIVSSSSHRILKPGKHLLKFWMVNPGIVLQKIVVDFGGLRPSYLGPPQSHMVK
jgi:hypothetical protein